MLSQCDADKYVTVNLKMGDCLQNYFTNYYNSCTYNIRNIFNLPTPLLSLLRLLEEGTDSSSESESITVTDFLL